MFLSILCENGRVEARECMPRFGGKRQELGMCCGPRGQNRKIGASHLMSKSVGLGGVGTARSGWRNKVTVTVFPEVGGPLYGARGPCRGSGLPVSNPGPSPCQDGPNAKTARFSRVLAPFSDANPNTVHLTMWHRLSSLCMERRQEPNASISRRIGRLSQAGKPVPQFAPPYAGGLR